MAGEHHQTNSIPDYAHVENPERYIHGGFHPIHLGEFIDAGERFKVEHKLGYNESSTTWLCFDYLKGYWVGVQIFVADGASEDSRGLSALQLFRDHPREKLESNYIFPPLGHFCIDGPNGIHFCLVLPFLGPALSYRLSGIGLDTPELLTSLCFQASIGLKYLHEKGICHGDFTPDNMRLQIDTTAMGGTNTHDILGKPRHWNLEDPSNSKTNGSQPRYLVEPVNIYDIEKRFRTGRVAIVGFGKSYSVTEIPQTESSDKNYDPPEVRLHKKPAGRASDIWSLAASIHLLRSRRPLLDRLDSKAGVVSWLSWAFGPFPAESQESLKEFLNDDFIAPCEVDASTRSPLVSWGDDAEEVPVQWHDLPREWAEYRRELLPMLLGSHAEQYSRRARRGTSKHNEDRDSFLPVYLVSSQQRWRDALKEREECTGYRSLIHEDLSRERVWYRETESLRNEQYNDQVEAASKMKKPDISETTLDSNECMVNDTTSQDPSDQVVSSHALKSPILNISKGGDDEKHDEKPDPEDPHPSATGSTAPERGSPSRKRHLTEPDRQYCPPSKRYRSKYVAEHTLRDQIECTEIEDMTKFAYRLPKKEVDVLGDLLLGMLKTDPKERIGIVEVVSHKWFGDRWAQHHNEPSTDE
ncbi:kinase-like domain-containing protein [Whalleya microplaca]|nr:kinase-like domain-containing protein [Whalleya microplaca]